MMRRIILLTAAAALAVGLTGCRRGGGERAGRPKPPPRRAQPVLAVDIDFDKLWPKEEVEKLAPPQRARLLELSLAGLRGANWQHAQHVLMALGKDGVPALIEMVESEEFSAAAAGPLPVSTRVKTVGELAHDTLVEIVGYHSNYKGKLPSRTQVAWAEWWQRYGAGLAIQ